MADNYTIGDDILIKKRPVNKAEEKELAEDLLQSEGYVPATKPRRVNGGQDIAGARHTARNKERLNSTLSRTPAQARFRVARRDAVAQPRAKAERAEVPFPIWSYVILVLTVVIIMAYVVHLCVEVSNLNATISDCNSTLVELKSRQNDLEFEKNKLYNLEEIERIARDEYGMVSADQLPKEYITSDNDDRIQIMDTGDDESAAGVLMSGFGRAVSNMLSYIN
ncbi:MAG: septum formation initiator family protein [Clostridia bacterium]|nr:septum formation initiator family protein [Clostridia bacterium]